jgi:hypothetical protein
MFKGASVAASVSVLSVGAELLLQAVSISIAALSGASHKAFLLIDDVIEVIIGFIP